MKTILLLLLASGGVRAVEPLQAHCEFTAIKRGGEEIRHSFSKPKSAEAEKVKVTEAREFLLWLSFGADRAVISVHEGGHTYTGADSQIGVDGARLMVYNTPKFDPDLEGIFFSCRFGK